MFSYVSRYRLPCLLFLFNRRLFIYRPVQLAPPRMTLKKTCKLANPLAFRDLYCFISDIVHTKPGYLGAFYTLKSDVFRHV